MMGNVIGVGIGAIELIPRLPISVEPSGIPARALVLGEVDEVGVEDAATLVEPDPHIPDIPDVSIVPEDVDIPGVAEIPDDDDIPGIAIVSGVAVPVVTGLPVVAAVAGAVVPAAVPPPS